jgi:hypothetical protein
MRKNNRWMLIPLLILAAGACARDAAVRVRLDVPTAAAVKLGDYQAVLLPGFFQENEVKDFDVSAVLSRFLADELKPRFKGPVRETTIAWEGAEALKSPEFWKKAAGAEPRTLVLSGRVHYARESRKALQEAERRPLDDGPFQPADAMQSHRAYILKLEILLVDGATGRILFQKSEQDTVTTRNLKQTAEFAFYDILGRLRPRLLRAITGVEQVRERYLLAK